MTSVKVTMVIIMLTYSAVHAELRILENKEMAKKSLLQDIRVMEDIIQIQEDTTTLYKNLKKLIAKMSAEGQIIREDVEVFLQNPLNQLHFMNRYTEEWKEVEDLVDKIQSNYGRVQKLKSHHNVDFEEELGQKFLLDLADIYDLDVENFTLGIVQGIPCGQELTADDCISIGSIAYFKKNYLQCEKWMTQAVKKIKSGEEASYDVNDVATIVLLCRENREKPISPSIKLYKELCRRRSTQGRDESGLKCYFIYSDDPWYRFERAKAEILSKYPDIVLYHELIPNHDVSKFLDVTRQKLMKASNKTAADSVDFLFADTSTLANRTKHRLDQVIGLDLENVKSVMVTHSARQYRTFFSGEQPYVLGANDYGVLLFLSDVESGGAAVFEKPAVNVVPHSGNVLVWEKGLTPATCPVVFGDRWIAKLKAKKVHELDNRKMRSTLDDWQDLFDFYEELERYNRLFDFQYDLF